MSTLRATLERITFHSESDGYTVARVRPEGRAAIVTIVGKLIGVQVGEMLALEGRWVDHPDHGRQLEVERYESVLPSTIDGIQRYLGSGLIKGIGPATAQRIVDTFGAYTLEVIDHEPERLREVPKLGAKKADLIVQAWREQQQIKTIMLFLQELSIPPGLAVRIYKQYGDQSLPIVRTNPYRLADEVFGIGFPTADLIARAQGIPADSPQRVAAGLRYALGRAAEDGNCYLPWDALVQSTTQLLEVGETEVTAALESSSQLQEVHLELVDGQRRVYLRSFFFAEQGVAARILDLLRAPSQIASFYRAANWPRVFDHLAEKRGVTLTDRQQEAVIMALTEKVSILTGGPGTGKTTCLRTVITALQARGIPFLLASPTGRAAKRLSEATGAEAQTLHRLLEYTPQAGGTFRRNLDNPLEAAVVVVDEASMLDIILAHHLLKAIPPQAHLLVVGDADQLPSVGPGRVLRDLLDSMALASVHLDAIFRQAEGSGIVANAHRINSGEQPIFDVSQEGDFFLFPQVEPEACATLTVELVAERVPRRFGLDPRRDIQVLVPTHRGPAGVQSLNAALQAALNPPAHHKAERRVGQGVLRVGDRVMQLRNNYDLEVFNGDVGEVVAVDPDAQTLTVRYDGVRMVAYDFGQLDELTLAYAISVHKSQGAEYRCVVIPLLLQHYALLQRNLLYTAVTRARSLVVVVGDRRAITRAVQNNEVVDRYTGLARRLVG
jgi:exodeoxyribonuclease V alpha subunit